MANLHQPRPERCPPEQRRDALLTLNEGLPPSLQSVLVSALKQEQALGENAFRGLYYLDAKGSSPAAVWLQELPGRTGVLWPPSFAHPQAAELLDKAKEHARSEKLQLVQMLLAEGESVDESLLKEKDFERLATLEYLWLDPAAPAEREDKAADDALADVVFLPNADRYPERLEGILEKTYQDTQDCPALNGVRDLSEVIEGYKKQGMMMPEHWYLLSREGQDAGVLILASHGSGEEANWELVYMGIAPDYRGKGLSRLIVGHAIEEAAKAKVSRLVLAVDATNEPALNVYRSLGFQSWQRRHVYACLHGKS
ncbi:MAG: GNAT family N-acetyltransferase [Lacipirellulaceae bacterium]